MYKSTRAHFIKFISSINLNKLIRSTWYDGLERLEMSIFLTGRDQSFAHTYVYAWDWSFYGTSCALEINILWYILGRERVIFSINTLIIKRFFTKKDKWLWNISHNFAIFDINLLQHIYYFTEINLFQPLQSSRRW